ncbi:MAG: hypothetical protein ACK5MT_21340 [Actinomycetales bacterium]
MALIAERVLELAGVAPGSIADRLDSGFDAYQRRGEVGGKRAVRVNDFWRAALPLQELPELARWAGGTRTPAECSAGERTGREVRRRIPEETAQAVAATARELEVSEFTVYLAAFGLVLAHDTYAERVSVATSSPTGHVPRWKRASAASSRRCRSCCAPSPS